MKKNIRVNIRGILFNIDEDAYAALDDYLKRIEAHFGDSEGGKEIIEDIENGIAEMMNARLSDRKEIINIEDVNEIIKAMGEPGEIDEDGADKDGGYREKDKARYEHNKRRLYRNADEKVVAGVCSGISSYLNIDVAIVRIIFILLTIFWGGGLLAYLILWAAVPEAVTTAQKLEMEGENVTIDNIERKIREELNRLGDQLNELKKKHFPKKKAVKRKRKERANDFGSFIALIAKAAFALLVVTIFISLILSLLAGIPSMFVPTLTFSHGGSDFMFVSIPELVRALIYKNANLQWAVFSLSSLLLIPFIAIVVFLAGAIFNIRSVTKGINKALGLIWLISFFMVLYSGIKTVDDFNRKAEISEKQSLVMKSDTFFVKLNPQLAAYPDFDEKIEEQYDFFDNNFLIFRKSQRYYCVPEIRHFRTNDSLVTVKIIKYGRGAGRKIALQKAQNVEYKYVVKDSLLELAPLFSFPVKDKWRNQKVKVKIYIPDSKHYKFIENPEIESEIFKDIQWQMMFD